MNDSNVIQLIVAATPVVLTFIAKLAAVLALFWIAVKVSNWLQEKVTHALAARDFDRTLSLFFGGITRWIVYIGALLACLSAFGIETTTFAAVIGAASLAVGLAFQGTLSNFAAGVVLLVFRPFKVGDVVVIAGETGTVAEIELFNTTIDSFENQRIILPNDKVFGSTIRNISYHPVRRVDVNVGVSYGSNVAHTREILNAAAAAVEGRHPDKGHQIVLMGLGGSSVDWQVRVWASSPDFLTVKERTIEAIKVALDDAGISIPFPQMDVHIDGAVGRGGAQA